MPAAASWFTPRMASGKRRLGATLAGVEAQCGNCEVALSPVIKGKAPGLHGRKAWPPTEVAYAKDVPALLQRTT